MSTPLLNLKMTRHGDYEFLTPIGDELNVWYKAGYVKLYYALGGQNYFSSKQERRGIWASIGPREIEKHERSHCERMTIGAGDHGMKFFLKELGRKSDKQLLAFAEKFDAQAATLAALYLTDRDAAIEAMQALVLSVREVPQTPQPTPAPAIKGMQLMTSEIATKLEKNPMMSGDSKTVVPVLAKFFTPDSSWTWYVLEGAKIEDGDYEFFGLVEGHDKELGYFRLSELQAARGNMNLPVERDRHFDGYVVDKSTNEVRKAA